jgi:hypothetical protein
VLLNNSHILQEEGEALKFRPQDTTALGKTKEFDRDDIVI